MWSGHRVPTGPCQSQEGAGRYVHPQFCPKPTKTAFHNSQVKMMDTSGLLLKPNYFSIVTTHYTRVYWDNVSFQDKHFCSNQKKVHSKRKEKKLCYWIFFCIIACTDCFFYFFCNADVCRQVSSRAGETARKSFFVSCLFACQEWK